MSNVCSGEKKMKKKKKSFSGKKKKKLLTPKSFSLAVVGRKQQSKKLVCLQITLVGQE